MHLQKHQFFEFHYLFQRYCHTLPVSFCNSAKYDLFLIKACLVSTFVFKQDIEQMVMQKVNQYISFKFGNENLLDFLNFLGGVTTIDTLPEA